MKYIEFRIDYQGMVDSKDFIKEFVNNFNDKFDLYDNISHVYYTDIDNNTIEDISSTLSIPIQEIERHEVHTFSKNRFGTDDLILNISTYFTQLQIQCTDYLNLNPYIEFINQYIMLLLERNKYLNIKRFGLRKIGSEIYFDFNEIERYFEKEYFPFKNNLSGLNINRSFYQDDMEDSEDKIKIIFKRSLDKGIYYYTEEDKKIAYQVLLDFDGYLDSEALLDLDFNTNYKSLIEKLNNYYLFELFKNCVTEEFLNKHLK